VHSDFPNALYNGIEKISVACLQPGSDSLPHVTVCCKSLVSQVLLKEPKGIEITGPYAANRTWKLLQHCGWEVMDHATYIPELAPRDFQLLGPIKEARDQQAICDRHLRTASCHLLPTDTWYRLLYAGTQILLPWRNKCLNANDDYVEVWCVPSATHVPYICRSQYKVPDIKAFVTLYFNRPCD
jgi:hypothetical protein